MDNKVTTKSHEKPHEYGEIRIIGLSKSGHMRLNLMGNEERTEFFPTMKSLDK
jgi:hypothetical protein